MTQRFTLRPYQQQAVDATLSHFRQTSESAVLVLPTGAGKSLVIAELARLAKRKILVVTHVQELVEQNASKYAALGLNPGIYSAGLKQRDTEHQVIFASIQSIARNLEQFDHEYSLIIIDECHRVSNHDESLYQQLIGHIKQNNPSLKVLGLTATPYRLGHGWIYHRDYRGFYRQSESTIFQHCIYDLPMRSLIKQGYLTEPKLINAATAHYDFSALTPSANGLFAEREVNELLAKYPRVTEAICEQVVELASNRKGVMLFAASVRHAREILSYLPEGDAELVIADTEAKQRTEIIDRFKQRQFKYLVNVAVLTTGFDAPHVDFIAILRPTQSVSLFQQMVGRGLRLSEGKTDCLMIDYANNGIDLFDPEVGTPKPAPDTEPVQVFCPLCDFANLFWGRTDQDGDVIEHFGRRCQGFSESGEQCQFRFKFKSCPHCGAENDIAARNCQSCHEALIDPDDLIKKALSLNSCKVIRCAGLRVNQEEQAIRVTYYDEDANTLSEKFNLTNPKQRTLFNQLFGSRVKSGQSPTQFTNVESVLEQSSHLPVPDFVVSRKSGKYWQVTERIFDYQGRYRKANQLY
ncbi:MAG: DEAD/DEAH box helicase family protein [Marinobacterium sp.]